MSDPSTSLPPGFRFHPTDEELILHYLSNRAASLPCPVSVIADVDIYKFDPWDLPALAKSGDREWYFFTPRDRKYPNGIRPNRAAASGYWKATGTDKPISGKGIRIGVKKALVFYMGRPPKGIKTDWIMHEYRLDRSHARHDKKPIGLRDTSMRLDDWVLCRIYKKGTSHLRSTMNPEDSNGEDAYLSSSPNTGELDCLKLPRPSSLTELFDSVDYSILSQLLDIPNEVPGSEPQCHFSSNQLPLIGTSNRSNDDSCSIGMLLEMDSPVSVFTMRRRMGEDCSEEGGGSIQYSPKKQRNSGIWSNPTNKFGSLQNSSLLNQAFINQQLLNSNLGLL